MNFVKLNKEDGSTVIVDCYNIAVVENVAGSTVVELYKGDDLKVSQTVDAVDALLAEAKANAIT